MGVLTLSSFMAKLATYSFKLRGKDVSCSIAP